MWVSQEKGLCLSIFVNSCYVVQAQYLFQWIFEGIGKEIQSNRVTKNWNKRKNVSVNMIQIGEKPKRKSGTLQVFKKCFFESVEFFCSLCFPCAVLHEEHSVFYLEIKHCFNLILQHGQKISLVKHSVKVQLVICWGEKPHMILV